jgi:uncharacterized membrane protein YedE/YeeE
MMKLLILTLKATALGAGFTVVMLIAFSKGNISLHMVFLALGMIALAIATILHGSQQ